MIRANSFWDWLRRWGLWILAGLAVAFYIIVKILPKPKDKRKLLHEAREVAKEFKLKAGGELKEHVAKMDAKKEELKKIKTIDDEDERLKRLAEFGNRKRGFRGLRCILIPWIVVVLAAGPALAEPPITPVKKDGPAPFTGLLVPELRYAELMDAEIDVEELIGKLAIQERLLSNVEKVYDKRLEAATRPQPWYETPAFNRWLGFGIGVVVTGFAVWAGKEIVEAWKR